MTTYCHLSTIRVIIGLTPAVNNTPIEVLTRLKFLQHLVGGLELILWNGRMNTLSYQSAQVKRLKAQDVDLQLSLMVVTI